MPTLGRTAILLLALGACRIGGETSIDPALAPDLRAAEARLAEHPGDPEAMIQLGTIEAKAGRWFQAADHFKAALEKAPTDPRPQLGLGDAYVKLGYWGPAYQMLDRCARLPQGNEDCLLRIGMLLRSDGSQQALLASRRYLDRFLQAAPNHARAEEVRQILRQIDVQLKSTAKATGEEVPAEEPIGEADGEGHAPDTPEHDGVKGDEGVGELNEFGSAWAQAQEAMQKRDFGAAEKAIQRAIEIQPEDAGAQAFLANVYLAQNKLDLATASAEKAYQQDSTYPYARWMLGLVLFKSGKDRLRGLNAWRALAKDTPEIAEKLGVNKLLNAAGAPR